MILVDSSVWISHLRASDKKLVTLLLNDQVLTHPYIIGEVACGRFKQRKEILDLLQKLPCAAGASFEEALTYLENEKLFGTGLGWVDIHLIASAKLSKAKLWTFDKKLLRQAQTLKIAL